MIIDMHLLFQRWKFIFFHFDSGCVLSLHTLYWNILSQVFLRKRNPIHIKCMRDRIEMQKNGPVHSTIWRRKIKKSLLIYIQAYKTIIMEIWEISIRIYEKFRFSISMRFAVAQHSGQTFEFNFTIMLEVHLAVQFEKINICGWCVNVLCAVNVAILRIILVIRLMC